MRDPLEGVSPSGTIVTGVARARVATDFEPALLAATELVEVQSGEASLYLYGSVATGQARLGVSDVDLLAVGLTAAEAKAISRVLSRRFATLCRAVDVGAVLPADYVGDRDAAYGNRVFLRHYCVHLHGPRRHEALADFPADARAARGFNGDIAIEAERWRVALDAGEDPGRLARRIARKSLGAVAGLVSVHDCTWTTDRESAARRWAAMIEPHLDPDVHKLVSWIDGHVSPGVDELGRILDGLVAELVAAFGVSVGLWGS